MVDNQMKEGGGREGGRAVITDLQVCMSRCT